MQSLSAPIYWASQKRSRDLGVEASHAYIYVVQISPEVTPVRKQALLRTPCALSLGTSEKRYKHEKIQAITV